MNKQKLSIATASVVLIPSLLLSSSAEAITFTKIADSSGSFSEVGGDTGLSPSINDAGTVVFGARLDTTDFTTTYDGIFIGNGEAITTIADNISGSFRDLQRRPSINNSNLVAFSALLDTDISGVFINNNGVITTIADSSGPLELSRGGGWFPSINDAGIVSFTTYLDAGGSAIFTSKDGVLTTIVDNTSGFFALGGNAINNEGTVVFQGFPINGAQGIFTSNGKEITTVADSSGPFSFLPFDFSINNSGTVAFSALLDTNDNGIFTNNSGVITTIADSTSLFNSVYSPSINDQGAVAFLAVLDPGKWGIFTGADPVADKVIATGDSLFGKTVAYLSFGTKGLNNSNQLAFGAFFSDGSSGIFRAELDSEPTPVPEPTSGLSLFALGSFCVGSALLKHKNRKFSQ